MLRVLLPTNQTCLALNKSGCYRLRKVGAKSRDYVVQQNLYMLHMLPAQGKRFWQQVT